MSMVKSMQNTGGKVLNRYDGLLESVKDKMMDRNKGHDQHSAIQESVKQQIYWHHNIEIHSNGSEKII